MTKNVMILSHEGNVRIDEAPQSITKNEIIEKVRRVLNDRCGKALTNLNNVEYYKNNEISEFLDESFGNFNPIPYDFYIAVHWDELT